MPSFLLKVLAGLFFPFLILLLLGFRQNKQPIHRMGNSDSELGVSPLASVLSGLSGLSGQNLERSVVLEDTRSMPRYEWREYNSWGDHAPGWYRGVGQDEWSEDLYGPFEETYPPGGPNHQSAQEPKPFTRTGLINTGLLTEEEKEDLRLQTEQATAELKKTIIHEYRAKEAKNPLLITKATNVWVEPSYIATDPRGRAIIQQVEKKWLESEKGRNSIPARAKAAQTEANGQKTSILSKMSKTPDNTKAKMASAMPRKSTEESGAHQTDQNLHTPKH